MLNVFCGSDRIKVREAAFALVEKAEANGARLNHLETESYQAGAIANALGAVSLFGGEELYLIDTPSDDVDFVAEALDNLKAMGESSNQFIVIEGALLAPQKKAYQKYAAELTEFKAESQERFNVFAMAEALLRKDKKTLWLLLTQAKHGGLSDEEIMGTLWWQLKSLWLAATTKSVNEAGMKDFPYNKAKRALSKFKDGEVAALSGSLLRVYHEGHGGVRDTDLALEQWVLTL